MKFDSQFLWNHFSQKLKKTLICLVVVCFAPTALAQNDDLWEVLNRVNRPYDIMRRNSSLRGLHHANSVDNWGAGDLSRLHRIVAGSDIGAETWAGVMRNAENSIRVGPASRSGSLFHDMHSSIVQSFIDRTGPHMQATVTGTSPDGSISRVYVEYAAPD